MDILTASLLRRACVRVHRALHTCEHEAERLGRYTDKAQYAAARDRWLSIGVLLFGSPARDTAGRESGAMPTRQKGWGDMDRSRIVFAAALMAARRSPDGLDVQIAAAGFLAESVEVARERACALCLDLYPVAAGWSDHQSGAAWVTTAVPADSARTLVQIVAEGLRSGAIPTPTSHRGAIIGLGARDAKG